MTTDHDGRKALGGRHLVLVGLMGAGKSSAGRSLAARLDLPFADADEEIEKAAGRSISDIFAEYGEPEFRRLEREVIARMLTGPQRVIATGGGAVMDQETLSRIKEHSVSVWLRVRLDVLVTRTARRGHRPLLQNGDSRETLRRLLELRAPYYSQADLVVDAGDGPPERTVTAVMTALAKLEPKE